MICPKCNKDLGFIKQLQGWDKMFGFDMSIIPDMPIYIALDCQHCHKLIGAIWINSEIIEIDKAVIKIIKQKITKFEKERLN